jgi:hypothetical protein
MYRMHSFSTVVRSDLDLSCQVKNKLSSLILGGLSNTVVQPNVMAQDKDKLLLNKLRDEMERLIAEAGIQTERLHLDALLLKYIVYK